MAGRVNYTVCFTHGFWDATLIHFELKYRLCQFVLQMDKFRIEFGVIGGADDGTKPSG
jgi:hypothetical protein